MRVENRELFVTFWDAEDEAAIVALLIGWEGDDPSTMKPVVAYDFGLNVLPGRDWKLSSSYDKANEKAIYWQERGT